MNGKFLLMMESLRGLLETIAKLGVANIVLLVLCFLLVWTWMGKVEPPFVSTLAFQQSMNVHRERNELLHASIEKDVMSAREELIVLQQTQRDQLEVLKLLTCNQEPNYAARYQCLKNTKAKYLAATP